MRDPKDNAQRRGDIHPPEVESDLPLAEGMPDSLDTEGAPGNRGQAAARAGTARPNRGNQQAGKPKDKDAGRS